MECERTRENNVAKNKWNVSFIHFQALISNSFGPHTDSFVLFIVQHGSVSGVVLPLAFFLGMNSSVYLSITSEMLSFVAEAEIGLRVYQAADKVKKPSSRK